MAFSATGRADVAGIIPENYSTDFLTAVVENSAVLSTFRTIRLGTSVTRMPVLSALPSAGFVSEYPNSGHAKPTTKATWTNETITVEEIATILPIPENVIEDSSVDLFAYVRPLIGEAFGKVIDGAILLGTVPAPATWTDPLVTLASTAGQVVLNGRTGKDLADDFNDTFAEVEALGFDVNTVFAGKAMRSRLRGLRASDGQLIYSSIKDGNGNESIYGADLQWVGNGAWDEAAALALAVDRSRCVVGIRSDMDYRVLTEATVDGVNLAESDMVALRVKMRLGWAINRGVNALGGTLPVAAYLADD